jgi:hypothetical protein
MDVMRKGRKLMSTSVGTSWVILSSNPSSSRAAGITLVVLPATRRVRLASLREYFGQPCDLVSPSHRGPARSVFP